MRDNTYRAAVVTCRAVLKPLIKILLKLGLSYKAFCDIAKYVYVDTVNESDDRRKTISDIAVRTGISRKEVGKVLDEIEVLPIDHSRILTINHIIGSWYSNSMFLDSTGTPKRLPIASNTSVDLKDLLTTAKIDIPYSSIIKALLDSGKVEKDESGLYYPVSRISIIDGVDKESILRLGNAIFAFINTIQYNIDSASDDRGRKMLERRAFVPRLSEEKVKEFNEICKLKFEPVLEEVDTWLMANSNEPIETDPNQGATGVGIYTYNFDRFPYS